MPIWIYIKRQVGEFPEVPEAVDGRALGVVAWFEA